MAAKNTPGNRQKKVVCVHYELGGPRKDSPEPGSSSEDNIEPDFIKRQREDPVFCIVLWLTGLGEQ